VDDRALDSAQVAEPASLPSAKQEDPATRRKALEGSLEIARNKLVQAELEQSSAEQSAAAALARARIELELSQARLLQFTELDRPNQLERARLGLLRAKDRAQEAADELAQIEIMYEEQDLQDRTAEFVVSRGRRTAERSAAQIKLEEQSLLSLEQHTLPQELKKLALDVTRKQDDLAEAERKLESTRLAKQIAVMGARQEIEKLTGELERLDPPVSP
jgi:hypothetical protein